MIDSFLNAGKCTVEVLTLHVYTMIGAWPVELQKQFPVQGHMRQRWVAPPNNLRLQELVCHLEADTCNEGIVDLTA